MTHLKITAKGQVTLKREILEHLGVQPGEQVEVELLPQGRLGVRALAKGNIKDLFGLMHDPRRAPVSIDAMNQVIADAWSGKRK